MPIWIGVNRQHDHIVQEPTGLVVVETDELIDGFNELLCTERLVGVKPTVDPHYSLALGPGQGCSVDRRWASRRRDARCTAAH